MSNTTSEHPVTPAAISVGSDGSPDQASPHTPGDNARNLGDDSFLPEILEPIYDSQEQEKKVKMAADAAWWIRERGALEDKIAKLQTQLATAERLGAVKELRRLADEWGRAPDLLYTKGLFTQDLRDRADELEREGK